MPLFIMIPFSEPYHTTVAPSLQAQYLPNFFLKLKILCADFLTFNLGFCVIHRKEDFPTLLMPRLTSVGECMLPYVPSPVPGMGSFVPSGRTT